MENQFNYRTIPASEIDLIRPLWERLRAIHRQDSVYFKEFYDTFTFETRTKKFRHLGADRLRVEIAEDGAEVIAYCVCTVEGTVGEIDSILVDEAHQNLKIGERLVRSGIAWLKRSGASRITVSVAHGHDSVFPFYARFGFYPRLTILELKEGPGGS